MEKNYVQIRFQSCKSDKSIGMLKHNVRTQVPNYLRDSMAHNKEDNTLFVFQNDNVETIENNTQIKAHYIQLKKSLMDYKDTLLNENKNFRKAKHALTQDSIITLSNSINDMYSNGTITKKEIDTLFLQSIKKIEKELNLKAIYSVIHYDEKTPHAHITFKGYRKNDKNKWQSVDSRGALKKQYSKAQDVVGEVFSEIGFQRGKRNSKTKHLSVQQMHQKEKENLLKDLQKQDLKIKPYDSQKIIQPTKNIVKKDFKYRGIMGDFVKLEATEIGKIDNYINKQNKQLIQAKNILQHKDLLKDLIQKDKTKSELDREIKVLQTQKNELQSKIILDTQHLKSVENEEKAITDQMQRLEKENSQLAKEVGELKNELQRKEGLTQKLIFENDNLANENEKLKKKMENMKSENYQLKLTNCDLQENLKKLENENNKLNKLFELENKMENESKKKQLNHSFSL